MHLSFSVLCASSCDCRFRRVHGDFCASFPFYCAALRAVSAPVPLAILGDPGAVLGPSLSKEETSPATLLLRTCVSVLATWGIDAKCQNTQGILGPCWASRLAFVLCWMSAAHLRLIWLLRGLHSALDAGHLGDVSYGAFVGERNGGEEFNFGSRHRRCFFKKRSTNHLANGQFGVGD